MSEDRDRLAKGTSESENEDVEAHRVAATDDPEVGEDDVEAHRIYATDDPETGEDDVEAHRMA